MNKKIISVIIAIVMMLSVVTVAVSADDRFPSDDNQKPCLTIGTVNYTGSGKVVVPVNVSRNSKGIWGANFQISYDSALTFDDEANYIDGNCIMQGVSLMNNDSAKRVITVIVTDTAQSGKEFENNTKDGTLLNLTFDVNSSDFSVGKLFAVNFAYTDGDGKLCIIDSNTNDVDFVFTNGGVKCVSSDGGNTNPPVTNPPVTNPPAVKPTTVVPTTKVPAATMNKNAKPVIKLAKGKKMITVTLKKKVANAKTYQIQYSTKKNFKNAKTKTLAASKKSLKIKSLKNKTKYFVRVRAVNGKTYSKWSKTMSVKTK